MDETSRRGFFRKVGGGLAIAAVPALDLATVAARAEEVGKGENLTTICFVHDGMVNLDDLVNMRPGMIVRCHADPRECVLFYDVKSGAS
jgi:hypothetical protein